MTVSNVENMNVCHPDWGNFNCPIFDMMISREWMIINGSYCNYSIIRLQTEEERALTIPVLDLFQAKFIRGNGDFSYCMVYIQSKFRHENGRVYLTLQTHPIPIPKQKEMNQDVSWRECGF